MKQGQAYYNEIDPYAAQWLRNLITAGHIAPGDVDERDIRLVRPDDLRGYAQCHFFAGIGVWSYALRLAGWPDEEPVWTGSCPCQPFSVAGRGKGHEDERHLWPTWYGLIRESRPDACFGEQVADGDGEAWLDHVGYDLEGIDYTLGAVSAAACGFGAPHERQRLFFVAEPNRARQAENPRNTRQVCGLQKEKRQSEHRALISRGGSEVSELAYADGGECRQGIATSQQPEVSTSVCGDLGDADHKGLARRGQNEDGADWNEGGRTFEPAGPTSGFWRFAEWLDCIDGKARPVEPGTFPLAHGAPARVGRLRAYGNAIVAPVAAEFIRAYRDVMAPNIYTAKDTA